MSLVGIAASTPPDRNLWCVTWFLIPFVGFSLLAAVGVWGTLAAYLPLPMPATRAEKARRPKLAVNGIALERHLTHPDGRHFAVFQLAVANEGIVDIESVSINVLAPAFVSALAPSDQHGSDFYNEPLLHTSESIPGDDDASGSVYWARTGLVFTAGTASPMYFRAELPSNRRLPVVARFWSANLPGRIEIQAVLDVPGHEVEAL